jgi:hypothetical protein
MRIVGQVDVMSLGFPGPKTITHVFLLPQKPHSCGFIIIQKNLLQGSCGAAPGISLKKKLILNNPEMSLDF